MKKISITLAGMLSISLALPAVAGPNWSIIHDAEAHKASHQQPAATKNVPTVEEVVPLDHGPRALSTPYLNKEREMQILAHVHNKNTSAFDSQSRSSSLHA